MGNAASPRYRSSGLEEPDSLQGLVLAAPPTAGLAPGLQVLIELDSAGLRVLPADGSARPLCALSLFELRSWRLDPGDAISLVLRDGGQCNTFTFKVRNPTEVFNRLTLTAELVLRELAHQELSHSPRSPAQRIRQDMKSQGLRRRISSSLELDWSVSPASPQTPVSRSELTHCVKDLNSELAEVHKSKLDLLAAIEARGEASPPSPHTPYSDDGPCGGFTVLVRKGEKERLARMDTRAQTKEVKIGRYLQKLRRVAREQENPLLRVLAKWHKQPAL